MVTNNALLALDWGSTHCRAYRLESGVCTAMLSSELGVSRLAPGTDFEQVLRDMLEPWLQWQQVHQADVILSGMIGSDRGWLDSGYERLPLALEQLAERLVAVPNSLGWRIFIKPGLSCVADGTSSVMRGEEVQLLGALHRHRPDCLILPGTHNKWLVPEYNGAQVRLNRFSTAMTGELYALLQQHSLVAAGQPSEVTEAGFAKGMQYSRYRQGLLEKLFWARSNRLLGQLDAADVAGYLSGLLIATEVAEQVASLDLDGGCVAIMGRADLAHWYAKALSLHGLEVMLLDDRELIIEGYRRIHEQIG